MRFIYPKIFYISLYLCASDIVVYCKGSFNPFHYPLGLYKVVVKTKFPKVD